ncbi:MAG TPA: PQQ-binding-like beta-propeller repeat protein, partial [Pirellulales bacterium]
MSIDVSSPPPASHPKSPIVRRWGWKPGWAIVGIAAVAIAYLQTVGVVDNGISNIATMATLALTFILLNLWLAFFAPMSGRNRAWSVAGLLALLAVAVGLMRVDGFTGNMRPRIVWRWTPNAEALIAAKPLDAGKLSLSFAAAANPTSDSASSSAASAIGGVNTTGAMIDVQPTDHDYPGFLGLNRDAFVPGVNLATDWNAHPPKLLWRQPIGIGYSGFALVGNAAITLEQRAEKELVTCYNLKTGELVWHHEILARHHDAVGGDGPESTPTIFDGKVYALGGTGVLRCLDAATGHQLWLRDVLADVGTDYETDRKGVSWGRSASPLVVDDLVVVPAGGPPEGPKISLVAYNKHTREKVWSG